MRRILKSDKRPYDVIIDDSFDHLKEALIECITPSSICIVTDTKVAPLYLETVKVICEEVASTCVHVCEAGEPFKNNETMLQIYHTLVTNQMDRKGLIIALGGGVIGDMAGFAAATYMRGVGVIQVPTTTVSQHDSSIGGKTGIDYLNYKNMIGAFYNPLCVYINTEVLKSLPERELIGGLAEGIKHGLIYDRLLFEAFERNQEEMLLVAPVVEEITFASCKVKCEVVEADGKEQGLRKILNLGHTIGHAIETLSNFTLSHGQCVAYGTVMVAYISHERGLLTEEETNRIVKIFKAYKLLQPFEINDVDTVWEYMLHDKKMAYGKISFILLECIGRARIVTDVTKEEVKKAMCYIEKTCL